MKTTQELLAEVRYCEICDFSHPLLEQDEIDIGLPSNSPGWITDRARLEDKCRTLESRLSEATALLERAEIYIETTTSRSQRVRDIRNTLLADLEKFTKTPDPRTEEQG